MRLCAGGKRSRIGQDGYQSKRVDPNFSTSVALLKAFFFTPLIFFWFFLLSRYYYYTRVSLSLFCFYWQTPGRIYSRRSVRVEKATLLFFSLSLSSSPLRHLISIRDADVCPSPSIDTQLLHSHNCQIAIKVWKGAQGFQAKNIIIYPYSSLFVSLIAASSRDGFKLIILSLVRLIFFWGLT